MKKLLLALSFATCLGYVHAAGVRGIPRSVQGAGIPNADMVGVGYSTSAFSSNFSTAFPNSSFSSNAIVGDGVVYGVIYSTGNCGDRVDFWDINAVVNINAAMINSPTYSNFNIAGSTTGAVASGSSFGGLCAGQSLLTWPIHFNTGIIYKPSSSGYNTITILYRKDGDE